VDWYYEFKLNLIVDERGELASILVTTGDVKKLPTVEALMSGVDLTAYR
jgi:hypothetical protein